MLHQHAYSMVSRVQCGEERFLWKRFLWKGTSSLLAEGVRGELLV